MSLFPPNIKKLQANKDVAGLTKALAHSNWKTREQAVLALGEVDGAQAVPSLIDVLVKKDEDLYMKYQLVLVSLKALAISLGANDLNDAARQSLASSAAMIFKSTVGSEEAARALERRFQDENKPRRAAAKVLGQVGAVQAIAPLVKVLEEEGDLPEAAISALGQIGAPAIQSLVETLGDDSAQNMNRRTRAAETLGKIGDEQAVKPLVKLLKDKNWVHRKAAAEALGAIGSPDAADALTAAIKDENNDVAGAAAVALGQLKGKPATGGGKSKAPSAKAKEEPKEKQAPAGKPFEHYTGSGVCDVCNQDVRPGEAYLVPVAVFYGSKKYHQWLLSGPFAQMIAMAGGIDAYLSSARAMDTTSHSAVCPNCIHLFEN